MHVRTDPTARTGLDCSGILPIAHTYTYQWHYAEEAGHGHVIRSLIEIPDS